MAIILLYLFAMLTMVLTVVCFSMHRKLRRLSERHKVMPDENVSTVMLGGSESTEAADRVAKATILIVGADDSMREELIQDLSKDCFEVMTAVDGGEGLRMACECNPDIVISDVMMPVLSGYELCSRLRENVETSHIAIILVSVLCERENIIYGLEAGADDYVTRPFDVAILRTRIHAIMKRHQAYRDNPLTQTSLSKMDYKSKLDKAFMDKAMGIVEERLSDSEFSINDLCAELAMSRSSVFNKIKALTGKGPNDVIKVMRLNKAHELLLSHEYNVSEVAFRVGFSDPKYFSTCFKKQFGISPNKV